MFYIKKRTTPAIRYLFYGTHKLADIRSGKRKLNQAKPNQNGIVHRNQLISGINCHTDYHSVIRDFDYYNHQKSNVKNKATEIVLAWHPDDFDFHKKEDVYEAMHFARHFAKRAFPNHMALLAAQFDTSGKRPVPHIHILVSQFNMTNLKVLRGNQLNLHHLRHIADKLTVEYNHKSPRKIIDMSQYCGTHHRTPTPAEMSVLKPLAKVLKYYRPTSQSKLRKACKAVGLKASFKRARRRSHNNHRGRRRRRRGLVFKSVHSNGWIKVSQLREFSRYCPGVEKLHNYHGRKHLFKANWQHIKTARKHDIKVIDKDLQPEMYDLEQGNYTNIDDLKADAKDDGVIIKINTYKKRNGQIGHGINYSLINDPAISYSGYQFYKHFGKKKGLKYSPFKVSSAVSFGAMVNHMSAVQHQYSLASSASSASVAAKSAIHSNRNLVARRQKDLDSKEEELFMTSEKNKDIKKSNVVSSASVTSSASNVADNASASAKSMSASSASIDDTYKAKVIKAAEANKYKMSKSPIFKYYERYLPKRMAVAKKYLQGRDLDLFTKEYKARKASIYKLAYRSVLTPKDDGVQLIDGGTGIKISPELNRLTKDEADYMTDNDDFKSTQQSKGLFHLVDNLAAQDDLKQHYINAGRQQEKQHLSKQLRIQPQVALDQFDRQNELDAKQNDWYKPDDFTRDQSAIRNYWQPSQPMTYKLDHFFSKVGSLAKQSASAAMVHVKSAAHKANIWLHQHDLAPADWKRVINHSNAGQNAFNDDIPFTKPAPLNKTIQRNIEQYHVHQLRLEQAKRQRYNFMHPADLGTAMPEFSSDRARQVVYIIQSQLAPIYNQNPKLGNHLISTIGQFGKLRPKDARIMEGIKNKNAFNTGKTWLAKHNVYAPKLIDLIKYQDQKLKTLAFRNGPKPDRHYLNQLKNPKSSYNQDKRVVHKAQKLLKNISNTNSGLSNNTLNVYNTHKHNADRQIGAQKVLSAKKFKIHRAKVIKHINQHPTKGPGHNPDRER